MKKWYNINLTQLYSVYSFLQFVEEAAQHGASPKTDSFESEVYLRLIFALGLNKRSNALFDETVIETTTTILTDGTRTVVAKVLMGDYTLDESVLVQRKDAFSEILSKGLTELLPDATGHALKLENGHYFVVYRPLKGVGEGLVTPVGASESSIKCVAQAIAIVRLLIQMIEQYKKLTIKTPSVPSANRAAELLALKSKSVYAKPYRPRVQAAKAQAVEAKQSDPITILMDAIRKSGYSVEQVKTAFKKVYPDAIISK